MSKNARIVVTEEDFARLRGLSSHPDLAAELGAADIVESDAIAPDVVTMNSRVLYVDESTGDSREVTLVFPHESDASARRVSILAPVGMALLGLSAGQSIVWPFPDGSSHDLRVLRVVYQPESDGEHAKVPAKVPAKAPTRRAAVKRA
jgi:regulator of nucleoside diphosphate kinase